jgi:hypothetical protein
MSEDEFSAGEFEVCPLAAAKQPAAAADGLCVICIDAPRDMCFVPCGERAR